MKKVFFGIALLFLSLVFVIYLDLLPEHREEGEMEGLLGEEQLGHVIAHSKGPVFLPAEEPTDFPVIVWWTPFTPFKRRLNQCPGGTCLVTHSRTELTNPATNVSAFVFYGTDFNLHDLPLPRKPHHLWALLHEESPKNNWILATPEGIALFNITSTVSRHSDYPLHLHYLHTLDILLQPVRTPTHLKSKGSLSLVMYMQSACDPPSDRDAYVEELMKYISVDSYGRCLNNKDLPKHLQNSLTFDSDEILDLAGKYKFVLSFENAICSDYFTEKFWRPLYAGSVPIVRGSPSIRDWDPSSRHPSMILAEDFKSAKELAEFLIKLDQNEEEYNKYLAYKTEGVTNKFLLQEFHKREWVVDNEEGTNFIDGFECFVCRKLHERKQKSSNNRIVANLSHYDCPSPKLSVERFKSERLEESQHAVADVWHWMSIAKCSANKAKVAFNAIGSGANQELLDRELLKSC